MKKTRDNLLTLAIGNMRPITLATLLFADPEKDTPAVVATLVLLIITAGLSGYSG